MTIPDVLQQHLQLCDELHQLALEENRFIKTSQQAPDAKLVERRKLLLDRLDSSLVAIKQPGSTELPAERAARERRKDIIEKSRTRILQILHLQRENEQLVLRYSLGGPKPLAVAVPPPPASQLQKLYDRHR